MQSEVIRLRPREERRLKAGHLWIYSNEIDTKATPLKQIEPGSQVIVENAQGKPLGWAMVNPHNLIAGRLVSRDHRHPLGKGTIKDRLAQALALRDRIYDKPYYRMVYGDSDWLPGLVVDRFGEFLVVQISNAGMEGLLGHILDGLNQLLTPKAILLKNDGKMRALENLPEYVESAVGDMPEMVSLIENNVKFEAPVYDGQKTGWFYDHRPNRQRLQHFSKDQDVLDICSYAGGWGVQAAAAGAKSATCVDVSAQALDWVNGNARLNDVADRVATAKMDGFDYLKQAADEKRKYDIIVLDPPAFIMRKKDIKAGEQAYQRMNELAVRCLKPNGILFSASCSMHLEASKLMDIIRASGRKHDRFMQVFEQGHQGGDHPIHPAIPETQYIKCLMARASIGG